MDRGRRKDRPATAEGTTHSTLTREGTQSTQNKHSEPGYRTDQLGHVRKTPEVTGFKFDEVDGAKRLIQFSNSTATAVHLEAPLIEIDLFNAREFVKRKNKEVCKALAENGVEAPTLPIVKTKFPRLANWFYDEEIKEAVFDKQHESARDWVVQVISDRLRLTAKTVDKYWRGRKARSS